MPVADDVPLTTGLETADVNRRQPHHVALVSLREKSDADAALDGGADGVFVCDIEM